MGARVTDSALFGHLWGTDETRDIFDEHSRIRSWVKILLVLAEVQSDLGVIPTLPPDLPDAERIAAGLDLDLAIRETRRTHHSMLGLIQALRHMLGEQTAEWLAYGTTVQDVTDTWMALAMKQVGAITWRDLHLIEDDLLGCAENHRGTVMAGRTHGQLGSPMTLGLKIASWAQEIRRHIDRLREGAPRWLVGQLGGGVGTLAFFGDHGLEVRRRFCARLELADPGLPWTASRDRLAEFCQVLALVAATMGRIGGEVYQLQRPEIGELAEGNDPQGVGSITMPHKRNPESAEHLATLARLVAANAQVLLGGMVAEHERDGRSWKAEWPAFEEVCLLSAASLEITRQLVAGLQIDAAAMRRNLDRGGGYTRSEAVLAHLAHQVGKHKAQTTLQAALAEGKQAGRSLSQTLSTLDLDEPTRAELARVVETPDTGASLSMVDMAVSQARKARAEDPIGWP